MNHITVFSLFKGIGDTQGVECSCELFAEVINNPSLGQQVERIRLLSAEGKTKEVSEAKKWLPACTFSGLSLDGSHKAERMQPTNLYMLDVDHVDDPDALWLKVLSRVADCAVPDVATAATLTQDASCIAALQRMGIAMAYKTPSGHGLRLVAWRVNAALRTIADNQAWLAAQTGIDTYDTGCKDISRLSFLVHRDDFYYLDLSLWQRENNLPFETPSAASPAAAPSAATGIVPLERLYTDEQQHFTFNGHLISEIAARWVEAHGTPQPGARHNYYMKMAKLFRNITDDDVAIMLCQLPGFGLTVEEREAEIMHVCKSMCSGDLPYDFAKFLRKYGYLPAPTTTAATDDDDDTAVAPVAAPHRMPPLPPVFKELCSLYPKAYHYPIIVAVMTVLGTLATRLRATYLDGRVHSPSFISVIYAPSSSGKSFVQRIVNLLARHLRAHDKVSEAREVMYQREVRAARNAQVIIPEPHCPWRMLPAVISVSKLLSRQRDAMGLHQLTYVPEIDTLAKSNTGGAWAQKSDVYRVAFDNDEYGQDYMTADTFSGTVNLYYNILMTGTINQVNRFFPDPENGLTQRACFAPIEGQEYAAFPTIKALTTGQLDTINAVLDRFEAMTYTRKSDINDEYTVLPEVNLDGKMGFLLKPLEKWLEDQRQLSLKTLNTSLDQFRRRSAVKAFRLGMVCVGMYDELTPHIKGLIKRFVLWFADMDLYYIEKAFGDKLRRQLEANKALPVTNADIYNELPGNFCTADLQNALLHHGRTGNASYYICIWARNRLIERTGKSSYSKTGASNAPQTTTPQTPVEGLSQSSLTNDAPQTATLQTTTLQNS